MKTIVFSVLFALGASSSAHAVNFLEDARGAWQSYQNGMVRASSAHQPQDTWGEAANPVPSRAPVAKPAAKSKSIVPDASNVWGEYEGQQAASPQQYVPRPAAEPVARPAVPRVAATPSRSVVPVRVRAAAQNTQYAADPLAEDEAYVVPPARKALPQPATFNIASVGMIDYDKGCANPVRMLEGARVLAMRGMEQRAYDAYHTLFSTCGPKDLLNVYNEARSNLSPQKMAMLMDEPVMAAPKLMAVTSFSVLQNLYTANEEGAYEEAYRIVKENQGLILRVNDAGAPLVAGWLEQRNKNYADAEQYFRRAVTISKDPKISNSAVEGLVLAALAQGKVDRAAQLVANKKYVINSAIKGEIALAQARVALDSGKGEAALAYIEDAIKLGVKLDNSVLATQAWALRAAGRGAEARAIFERLYKKDPQNSEYQQGYVESLSDSKDLTTLKGIQSSLKGEAQARAQTVIASAYQAQGRRGMAVETTGIPDEALTSRGTVLVGSRNKSGDVGEEKLTHNYMGVGAKAYLTSTVALDATVGSNKFSNGVSSVTAKEAEIGLTVEGDDGTLRMTAGQIQSTKKSPGVAYGSVAVKTFEDDGGYFEGMVGRKPVQDSVKSVQHGIAKTFIGANGKVVVEPNTNLAYAVELGSAGGKNVKGNAYYEANASYNWELQKKGWSWLSVGPEVAIKGYSEDNNRFDAKHGGYYSPLSQYDFGVKANALSQEGGKMLLKGTVRGGVSNKSLYDSSMSGMYLEGSVGAGWLLNPYLAVGAGLGVKSSTGYSDTSAWLWATIPFEKRKGLYAEDLQWGFNK